MSAPHPPTGPVVVDAVVVGGGVMGAAAAWQLARRGREVVLLERFGPAHTRGASHGTSRIYRQTYLAAPYVRLAEEALALWQELEAETGAALLTITGGVDHGDPRRTGELARSLAVHGIAHHWLDPDDAALRWPGMRFDGPALVQPDRSGRLHADHAVAALTTAAGRLGAEVRHNSPATGIRVRSDPLVQIDTPPRAVLGPSAVVAVGAWTAGMLDGLVPLPPLRVTQEQPAHFPRPGIPERPPDQHQWPTFVHHTPDSGGVYGLTAPNGDVKVGLHGVGPACDPERRTFRPEPGQLRRLQEYVAAWLPGLDHTRPDPISCTYTTTPDSNFVVRRTGPLVVGAGFSGHGFKFAPAIGRVLADLATDVTTSARSRT